MTKVNGFRAAGNLINRQCNTFSRDLIAVDTAGVRACGELLVGAVSSNMGANPLFLRGAKKKVSVVMAVRGGNNPQAIVHMTGPAKLIEEDVRPHLIIGHDVGRLGKGKGSRSAEAKHAAKQALYNALFGGQGGGVLKMPGSDTGFRTGPVQHPGTKGKHPFRRGINEIRPIAPEVFRKGTNKALRKAFL